MVFSCYKRLLYLVKRHNPVVDIVEIVVVMIMKRKYLGDNHNNNRSSV